MHKASVGSAGSRVGAGPVKTGTLHSRHRKGVMGKIQSQCRYQAMLGILGDLGRFRRCPRPLVHGCESWGGGLGPRGGPGGWILGGSGSRSRILGRVVDASSTCLGRSLVDSRRRPCPGRSKIIARGIMVPGRGPAHELVILTPGTGAGTAHGSSTGPQRHSDPGHGALWAV